jgi:hypothetical protein
MRLAFVLFGLFSIAALAQESEKTQFCEERLASVDGVQKLIRSPFSQLTMKNQGGLFNGGVCWWHSRFTRNAAYLMKFEPSLPKPTTEEAKQIIMDIRKSKGVTVVPGYHNLMSFSYDYEYEIQQRLNDWQKTDGFINQKWIQGLKGNTQEEPEKLKKRMDELFERVQRGEVVYQMLQIKGIDSHAWLVTGMTQTPNGFILDVIDSNYMNDRILYQEGVSSFKGYGNFLPYTQRIGEEVKLRKLLEDYCAP